MIRNVLVMKSGLVLFSREFANTVQQVCDVEIIESYMPTASQYFTGNVDVGTCDTLL